MRRIHNARIVPDHVPAGLADKVVKISDLGVSLDVALGNFRVASDRDLLRLYDEIAREMDRRGWAT